MKTKEQILKLLDAPCDVEIDGFRVRVFYDDDPLNPRKEYDNVGKMVCWHRRYDLGDEQPKQDPNEYRESVIDPIVESGGVCLPLYLYDHSGITMSTGAFNCPWDSGQVGWIYATKEQIDHEWGGDVDVEKARKYLEGEVETYDQYLRGDVYGYTIEDEEGNDLDSCWGFFGGDYIQQEVASSVYRMLKERRKRLVAERKAEREHQRMAEQCSFYVGG